MDSDLKVIICDSTSTHLRLAALVKQVLPRENIQIVSSDGPFVRFQPAKLRVGFVGFEENFYDYTQVTHKKFVESLDRLSRLAKSIYVATSNNVIGDDIADWVYSLCSLSCDSIYRLRIEDYRFKSFKIAWRVRTRMKKKPWDMYRIFSFTNNICERLLYNKVRGFGITLNPVAGHLLSVIMDRESFVRNATPQYRVIAHCVGSDAPLRGRLQSKALAESEAEVIRSSHVTLDIETDEQVWESPKPYEFFGLVRDASIVLGFSLPQFWATAQSLHTCGLITNFTGLGTFVHKDAYVIIKEYIIKLLGSNYFNKQNEVKTLYRGASIHPTNPKIFASQLDGFSLDERSLYHLIWQRFCAGFLKPAEVEYKVIRILGESGGRVLCRGVSCNLWESGYLRVIENKEDRAVLGRDIEIDKNRVVVEEYAHKRLTDEDMLDALRPLGFNQPELIYEVMQFLVSQHYIIYDGPYIVPRKIALWVIPYLRKNFAGVFDRKRLGQFVELLAVTDDSYIQLIGDYFHAYREVLPQGLVYYPKSQELCDSCKEPLRLRFGKNKGTDRQLHFICDQCKRQFDVQIEDDGKPRLNHPNLRKKQSGQYQGAKSPSQKGD